MTDEKIEEIVENEEKVSEELPIKETSLEEKNLELEKENLRLRADMENLRKRAYKEKTEFARYANENLLSEIIPVIDNFERATQVSVKDPEFEKFLKGFKMIQDQLEYILKTAGLEKVDSLGKLFDPNFHEAVEVIESNEGESGTVVEEMRSGYKFGEKVVRPALVKVIKN